MSNQEVISEHMFFHSFDNGNLDDAALLCNNLLKSLIEDNKYISSLLDKYFKICPPSKFFGVKKMPLQTFAGYQGTPVLELVRIKDDYKFAFFTFGKFLSPLNKKDLKKTALTKALMDFFTEPERYIKKEIDEVRG